MTASIEDLLRKAQGTQIGQRDELEDAWVNSGYVFSQPNGTAIDPDLITKAFKKMVMELGMPHLTPHGLRHQYATAAREAGVDILVSGTTIFKENEGNLKKNIQLLRTG